MDVPLRTVLDALDEAVFVHGADGAILDVNARALEMFRVSRDEALRLSLARDCSAGGNDVLRLPGIWSAVLLGRSVRLPWNARRPGDGTEFAAELVLARLETPHGPAVLATVRDVSWTRAGDAFLARRAQELARANEELQRFADVAARNLEDTRALLAAGGAGGVAGSDSGLDAAAALRVNERLAEYARVNFARGAWEPVACGDLVRAVQDLLAAEIARADARITVEPLPTLLGDRGQLLVLFRHLLANALRHAGDTPPRIHVKAERDAGAWCFTVTDNGPGLPLDELARLRARGAGSIALADTAPGLGLELCRAVVEKHGGRLWAVSDPRRGTAVHFTLSAGASG